MLHNDSFVSLDPLSPNGDKTIAICRPVPITDDTRKAMDASFHAKWTSGVWV